MIIHSMTLQNFRAYREAHTLDLTPESPTQPIILVTGLNGAGKTTLLEALNLALYGKLSPMSRGIDRIQSLVLEGFQKLVRKISLVSALEVLVVHVAGSPAGVCLT